MRKNALGKAFDMGLSPSWVAPDVPTSALSFAVGSSVLQQFAHGHSIGDVLRELVQNEYDGRGSALEVEFGEDGLHVGGTGDPIDRAGWSRLSVMLGTGRVAGEDRNIKPKINGIGSKNHGIRSLFLVGDRIYVRSGGLQTLLDLQHGAPRTPFRDDAPPTRGVRLFVPYRSVKNDLLEPYDAGREKRDLEVLRAQLAPTLMRLARPGAPKSVRQVTVRSLRQQKVLSWRQDVRLAGRHGCGGAIVRREITLADSSSDKHQKLVELEYEKSLPIPLHQRDQLFPGYFRARGASVRLGVSLRLDRNRVDVRHRGSLFYPLGMPQTRTGSGVSLNAPFQMNADRTAIVDPGTSSWNDWLLDTLAEFTVDLLVSDWFRRFGRAAYLAIDPGEVLAESSHFAERLDRLLRTSDCWPTCARANSSRRPAFVAAEKVYVGASPSLDAVVPDEFRLHRELGIPTVSEMLVRMGAKAFTLASAVRLRCAGSNDGSLATRVAHPLYYTHFPAPLRDLQLQKRFAAAFEAHRRQLTDSHRRDIASSPSTLTAAESLDAAEKLWVVESSSASIAPIENEKRLHSELVKFRVLRNLCTEYDPSEWALDVCQRAIRAQATETERERLYEYLLRAPHQLRTRVWPTLRRSPVVRDHRGDWTSPSTLVHSDARWADRLESALQFPSAALSANADLLKRLQVRRRVTGDDLVAYADIVSGDPSLADEFEATLETCRTLLTPSTIARLRSIAFLRSSTGQPVSPMRAFIRSARLVQLMGDAAPYAAGERPALYRKLGCQTQPSSEAILRHLDLLRLTDASPSQPELVYTALLAALRGERLDPTDLADRKLLHDGKQWVAPRDCLFGRRLRDVFLDSVPIFDNAALRDTYIAFGVETEPQPRHWRRLFDWVDSRGRLRTGRLPERIRRALRLAYTRLDRLPADLPPATRAFLATDGCVYSLDDVRAGNFLIDDDPVMADAVRNAPSQVSFADLNDPQTRRFYQSSGVSLLTHARRLVGIHVGVNRKSPAWFNESELLGRMHSETFAAALAAVAAVTDGELAVSSDYLRKRLRAITAVRFVSTIETSYALGTAEVSVQTDVAIDERHMYLVSARSRAELNDKSARVVASLLDVVPAKRHALSDSIYRLLTCDSDDDIARYLRQRGIPWRLGERLGQDDAIDDAPSDDLGDVITEELTRTIRSPRVPSTVPPPSPNTSPGSMAAALQPPPLPPIGEVRLVEVEPAGVLRPLRQTGSRRVAGGVRVPRTPVERERDQLIGHRAEELVYLHEIERVRAMGLPVDRVVWTSSSDPLSDHDIRSVADDGGDLWIEVKATTGRDGRFDWPRAEFDRALVERDRYVLCRIYEADSHSPTLRRIVDPVGGLVIQQLRLDVASLAAEVAPLG